MHEDVVMALTARGWAVDCESPLELSKTDGSMLRGESADALIAELLVAIQTTDHDEPNSIETRLTNAHKALQLVIGEPAERDSAADERASRNGRHRPPYITKDERQRRADKEREVCDFLTECSNLRDGPARSFKRIADYDIKELMIYGLDAVSEDGLTIVDIIEVHGHALPQLDEKRWEGAGVKEWKIDCMRTVCRRQGTRIKCFHREHAFKSGMFVYCDKSQDIYRLTLSRIEKIIRYSAICRVFDPAEYPRLNYGYFNDGDDPCWFFPSCY